MFDPERLFSSGLPSREWRQFPAEGFSQPVCSAIFRADQSPCCGVPLGGISIIYRVVGSSPAAG